MLTVELNMYHGVALGSFLFWLGGMITDKVSLLNRYCIPAPLVGGLCFSILNCILYSVGIASISFDATLQTVFMIMFFTTVGFTVSIPTLLKGGKAVILCLFVSILMIPLQNFLDGGVMQVFGQDPLLGIGCGSIALIGGPGTAAAFGPDLEAAGAVGGSVVSIAAATFGLVAGSLISGPTARRLIEKHDLRPAAAAVGGAPGAVLAADIASEDEDFLTSSPRFIKGFMLLLPTKKQPTVVEPFVERRKLFETLKVSADWGRKVGIETVGDLNDQICNGSLSEMILVQEAEQERKIGEIAKDIVNRGNVKFVMIAGPSSSGKTSFSHRLSIQLRTLGKVPHPIGLDDYFVDREFTPLDENGKYNFECLEAIDIKQFNADMIRLLKGERVELPTFNFKTGKREYRGKFKQLGADDILVIEGIHGLNDKTSYALPAESKYKIYISALTNINIDEHNRIPTTDGRLLRRMVRDARTRGSDARKTIEMWPSVRRGEEENIFPFQEEADAMFNSVLIYELAVLKQFAEPLLFQIPKNVPEYYEAKRLLKFLDYFLNVTSESLPNNSICREFVGGSCFNV